jgi:hypothetical protein
MEYAYSGKTRVRFATPAGSPFRLMSGPGTGDEFSFTVAWPWRHRNAKGLEGFVAAVAKLEGGACGNCKTQAWRKVRHFPISPHLTSTFENVPYLITAFVSDCGRDAAWWKREMCHTASRLSEQDTYLGTVGRCFCLGLLKRESFDCHGVAAFGISVGLYMRCVAPMF